MGFLVDGFIGTPRRGYSIGDKIIDELQNARGWNNGLIRFKEDCFIRENEVVGIDLSKEY